MKIVLSLLLTATSAFAFSTLPKIDLTSSSSTRLAGAPSGAKDISALTKDLETVFTTEQIDEILPHRYPFALVDKVIEYEAGKRAVGVKSVTKVSIHLVALKKSCSLFCNPFKHTVSSLRFVRLNLLSLLSPNSYKFHLVRFMTE